MPRKLKRALVEIAFLAGGFGLVQGTMETMQDFAHFAGFWKCELAAWGVFLLVMAWKLRGLYIGLYRDGSFFYDNRDDE